MADYQTLRARFDPRTFLHHALGEITTSTTLLYGNEHDAAKEELTNLREESIRMKKQTEQDSPLSRRLDDVVLSVDIFLFGLDGNEDDARGNELIDRSEELYKPTISRHVSISNVMLAHALGNNGDFSRILVSYNSGRSVATPFTISLANFRQSIELHKALYHARTREFREAMNNFTDYSQDRYGLKTLPRFEESIAFARKAKEDPSRVPDHLPLFYLSPDLLL